MTQEVQQEIAEVTHPEVAVTDAPAEKPEVAEQETEVAEQHEETLEEKVARLEKESHGKQRRIDKQAAKLQAEREQAARLRAHLERINSAQNPNQQQATPENIERHVQDLARAVEIETKAVVKIEGLIEQDPKFVENLKSVAEEAGPLVTDRGLPTPLLNQILDCEKPTKVLKYLASNPEVAASLEGLSPTRLAKKLTLIEEGMKTSPKISKNPEPINPIGQKGRGTAKSPDDMSMEEYIDYRKKQGARWAR